MNYLSFLTLSVLTMAAYLIGGLPFGYWFVRLISGKDVRTIGSGNIGATNVHRAAGTKAGLIVLLLDIVKGFAAVWIASATTHGDDLALALAASAAVVGHCYPVFLKLKGGKAVACFIGAFGFIAPLSLLATAAVFFLVVFWTRFVSLGSISGAFLFQFFFWYLYRPPPVLLYASAFCGLLIVYRHRANIRRLLAQNESKFAFKRAP